MKKAFYRLRTSKMGKKGFTLVELLIVVAIISILVAIAVPVFTQQLENADQAVDDANIRSAYVQYQAELVTGETSADIKTPEQALNYVEEKSGTELKYYSAIKIVENTGAWLGDETSAPKT